MDVFHVFLIVVLVLWVVGCISVLVEWLIARRPLSESERANLELRRRARDDAAPDRPANPDARGWWNKSAD
jgi:hypothetical protein